MQSPIDFWLGSWAVHDSATGALAGTNRIARALDGNAVIEEWHGTSGVAGMSLFYLDRAAGTWRQTWATSLGFAKQKTQVDADDASSVRFEGVVTAPDGTATRDRTTLTPLAGGAVRQVIEVAPAGGGAWEAAFDAIYTPTDVSPDGETNTERGYVPTSQRPPRLP
jgi:hypothetical protein